MMRRALIGCLLAMIGGCREADEPSQTIVWVDAESSARDALAHLTLQAIGPNNRLPIVETHEPSWPVKLVLAPKDGDASRRFTVEIEGRDANDALIATFRFRTGFVASETRAAKLMIHDACVMPAADGCNAGDACSEWSFDLDADKLGRGEQHPLVVQAKCEPSTNGPPETTDVPTGQKTDPIKQPSAAGTSVPVAGSSGTDGTATGAAGASGGAAPVGTGQQSPDCPLGHVRDANGCVDIDECQTDQPCGDHGQCVNKVGTYGCTCEEGFEEKAGTCHAVDHCQTNNGGCEGPCTDSTAGAVCACAADESLKADRKACGKLGPAKRIDYLGSKEPTEPRFAFDGSGNGVAVWVYSDGTTSSLWTRRYVAGSGWTGIPSKVATPADAGQPSSPRIALDPNGAGLLVWLQSGDSGSDIWSARWTGQAFGTPQRISIADTGTAFDPSVALDRQGNGFAAWTQAQTQTQSDGSSTTTTRVWVNRFRAAMGWSTALPAQTASDASAFSARLSLDGLGNATVAWTQAAFSDSMDQLPEATVWAVRFDVNLGRWRLPATKLDDTGLAGFPDAQMFGTEGTSLAIWPRLMNGRMTIRASRFDAASGWSDSTNIAMADFGFTTVLPRVALSSGGRGAAVWVQSGGQLWGNQFDAGSGAWTGAKQLRAFTASQPVYPQIAVDSVGDGFAVWSEIQGTARVNYVSRLTAAGGFGEGAELSKDTTADPPDNSVAQVTADEQGDAVVIWDVWSGDQYETWASVFE